MGEPLQRGSNAAASRRGTKHDFAHFNQVRKIEQMLESDHFSEFHQARLSATSLFGFKGLS
jgi:hypothetical protein